MTSNVPSAKGRPRASAWTKLVFATWPSSSAATSIESEMSRPTHIALPLQAPEVRNGHDAEPAPQPRSSTRDTAENLLAHSAVDPNPYFSSSQAVCGDRKSTRLNSSHVAISY